MKKTHSSYIIGNALIWAALMIAFSLLFKSHDNTSMVIMLMIAGWLTTQELIQKAAGQDLTVGEEVRCIKSLFNGKGKS